MQLYKGSKDVKKLIYAIIYSEHHQFAIIFKDTAVVGIVSNSAPETFAGIQATVSKNIASLKHLQPTSKFSIRKWFNSSEE